MRSTAIGIAQRHRAYTGGDEKLRDGRTQAAGADHEGMRGRELFLRLDPELGQQDMAAVAQELRVIQRRQLAGGGCIRDRCHRRHDSPSISGRPRVTPAHSAANCGPPNENPGRPAETKAPGIAGPATKTPGNAGRCANGVENRYCGFACAETAFAEAITGSPFSWFIPCVSWKSSAEPNTTRGAGGGTTEPADELVG